MLYVINMPKYTVSGHQQYFLHNFDKFKYIVVIFGKQERERNVKLSTVNSRVEFRRYNL